MTPQAYCRQQAAQSGSSFYYSFLFLPPAQRDAIMALYAFCRAVDDVVDTVQDPSVAASKLNWWRGEIDRMFAADPAAPATHPICLALHAPALAYGIRTSDLHAVIAGMEMDLNQHRYVDDEALSVYCWRVAGVVGQMSARIFKGDANTSNNTDAQNRDITALDTYALHMGQALQRINIIRDVGEDALRGRVYLPVDVLTKHGLKPADVLNRTPSAAMTAALGDAAALAKFHLNTALDALPKAQVRAQRSGLIMGRVYAALLAEIERSQFAVLHQRVSLTPLKKLSLAWRSWVAPYRAVKALRQLAK